MNKWITRLTNEWMNEWMNKRKDFNARENWTNDFMKGTLISRNTKCLTVVEKSSKKFWTNIFEKAYSNSSGNLERIVLPWPPSNSGSSSGSCSDAWNENFKFWIEYFNFHFLNPSRFTKCVAFEYCRMGSYFIMVFALSM